MEIVAATGRPVRATSVRRLPRCGGAQSEWRDEMRLAVRDPAQLVAALELPSTLIDPARRAARDFPLFVPRPYLARMRKRDAADPLLRQVLPVESELISPQGFTADPVGDESASRSPGLLQKYSSRALLITTGACAVHCRYCFRRHFPYSESPR